MKHIPRTIAIGDVHGCSRTLNKLLNRLILREGDTLVFVGDYCDRGPDSRGVIETVLELQQRDDINVVALKGNHEDMWLGVRAGTWDHRNWMMNGGNATLASYTDSIIPKEHLDFLESLPLYYETDTHFFVHADPSPFHPLGVQKLRADIENTFLWNRDAAGSPHWEKIVVCGHTPGNKVVRTNKRICIDTACVFGGTLTAYSVEDDETISMPLVDKVITYPAF